MRINNLIPENTEGFGGEKPHQFKFKIQWTRRKNAMELQTALHLIKEGIVFEKENAQTEAFHH